MAFTASLFGAVPPGTLERALLDHNLLEPDDEVGCLYVEGLERFLDLEEPSDFHLAVAVARLLLPSNDHALYSALPRSLAFSVFAPDRHFEPAFASTTFSTGWSSDLWVLLDTLSTEVAWAYRALTIANLRLVYFRLHLYLSSGREIPEIRLAAEGQAWLREVLRAPDDAMADAWGRPIRFLCDGERWLLEATGVDGEFTGPSEGLSWSTNPADDIIVQRDRVISWPANAGPF